MTGWIKLYRDLLEKPIWIESTPEQKTIFVTLLMMVNHQEHEWEWKGERYKLSPGQVITSLESIVHKCGKGVSIQNVRTALKRFEKLGFLTNQSTNRNRLITLNNWGGYQGVGNMTTNKLTNIQQTANKQLTTNKNEKEIKNKINDISNHKASRYDEETIHFRLSVMLLEHIRKNIPQFKEPNLQKWSDVFRLMIERDNRTEEQIVYLIEWCQQDSFWKSNILSPVKLRKRFDQLIMKADSYRRTKHTKSTQQLSLKRPSHWRSPHPLTKEEYFRMKETETRLL